MRNPLLWSASISVLVIAAAIWMVATEGVSAAHAIPDLVHAEASATRAWLHDQIAELRIDLFAEIHSQSVGIRGDVMGRVDAFERDANGRLGDALNRYDATLKVVDGRTGEALAIAKGTGADLKPVLVNAAALIKDGQDSLDDVYWDGKALVESATVATTQFAQASETFNKNFPVFIATMQETNIQIKGATTSLNAMFAAVDHKFFHPPPQTKKQKAWGTVKDLVFVGSRVYGGAR